ncbi:interleukin-31 receptor subunit alpha isoform X2 [Sphaerodactylus townsendi]|nr:interleukin-31 receptor subunit alpha isoform X2 [Sphaerodactylus townsendi]
MLYTLVWTLTVLCKFCLADGDVNHHRMFPLSPITERGSHLELFCSLGKKLYPYKNASHIIWTINGNRIPKENYIIVNDSVAGVVIHNFTYGEANVKCYVDFPVEKQLLAHTEVKSGFPPQRPENISCINYGGQNITCSWTFEKDTNIETNYTIIGSKHPDLKDQFLNYTWRSKNSSRLWNFSTKIFYPEFCIQLKLENRLGKAESSCIPQRSEEILKLDPPPVKVKKIPGVKKMLTVSWGGDMEESKCQIRYRNLMQNDLKDTHIVSNISLQNDFNLTNLWSFTEYAVAIRCIVHGSRFWSEWSREQKGITEEEAPSKEVDLWRVLGKCQPNGSRQIHLFWKQLKENESLGIIKGYRIRCFTQSNRSQACAENTTNKLVTVQLTEEAYLISVIAYNAAGDSPEAVLTIPSCSEESQDQPRVVMLNASALNEQMIVEWKTDPDIHSFVIEWYDVLETNASERSWQYVKNASSWIFQKGAFEQYKCYNISVYPVYKDEIKAPSSITTYFEEGRPSHGPAAEVENIDKSEATIKWKEIEKASANGDIINYTIFYRPEGGKELGKTVNASLLQYRLKFLQANVKYTAHIMASTIAGGTNGSAVTFITNQLSVVEIIFINVFAVMVMLCLITFGLLWALKRRMLKRIFWPKIPHPKLPEMIPGNLEKQLKEPQSEENTVIPEIISILKVGDHDKRQLLDFEDCLGQTKVTEEGAVCLHEASGSGGHEAIKPLLQTPTTLGQQLVPAPVSQQPPLQRSEESLSEHCQKSNHSNEEKQDQPNTKEKTEFNPYLRNSVHTREFLVGENLSFSKKTGRKKETVPGAPCRSSDNGQQYVALDAVVL